MYVLVLTGRNVIMVIIGETRCPGYPIDHGVNIIRSENKIKKKTMRNGREAVFFRDLMILCSGCEAPNNGVFTFVHSRTGGRLYSARFFESAWKGADSAQLSLSITFVNVLHWQQYPF